MIAGNLIYRAPAGSGPIRGPVPLPHFFFSYEFNGESRDAITDGAGDFTIDANVGDDVTFKVYSHNAVVQILDGYGAPILTDPFVIEFTETAITAGTVVTAQAPAPPPVGTVAPPIGMAFGAAIQIQEAYQNGLMEFPPFGGSAFPSGRITTRADNDQIDVALPGVPGETIHLASLRLQLHAINNVLIASGQITNAINSIPNIRAFTNPNPIPGGNPTIHFEQVPQAQEHEIGHALQFIRSTAAKRLEILVNYIPFLIDGGEHRFNFRTNDFVAFLEAFATFADEYLHSKRTPLHAGALVPPAPTALHTGDHQLFFFRFRHYQPPIPAAPPAPAVPGGFRVDNPTHFQPNDHTANAMRTNWVAGQLEEIEGAVFAALFVDYAGHVGLNFVVESYIVSQTITTRDFALWIRGKYGSNSPEYVELQRVLQRWNMYSIDPLPPPAGYLNAPIRASELVGATNVTLDEVPFQSNPSAADPPPGALRISWQNDFRGYVKIAPVFDGWFRFEPDASAVLPATAANTVIVNHSSWNVIGKILLFQIGAAVQRELRNDLNPQRIPNPPDRVLYEPVELTKEFLFETLLQSNRVTYSLGAGVPVPASASDLRQFVFDFVHGQAWAQLDAVTEFHSMPIVAAAGPGPGEEVLYLTMASRSPLATNPAWWTPNSNDSAGIPWSGPGSPPDLVDSSLTYAAAHEMDSRHPSHTIIPSWLVLTEVNDRAWRENVANHPLITAIKAGRSDGREYKRIEISRRQPASGWRNKDQFHRQFPMHQLVATSTTGGQVFGRVPASGQVYLAVEPGNHEFKAMARWEDPTDVTALDASMQLAAVSNSTPADVPKDEVTVDLQTNDVVELVTGQIEYDGAVAWEIARDAVDRGLFARFMNRRTTGLALRAGDVPKAIIPVQFSGVTQNHFKSHRPIYGHAIESAARHDLRPELVLANFLTPALSAGLFPTSATSAVPYDPDKIISGEEIGLFAIGDNMSGHTVAAGIAAGFSYQTLVNDGLVDPGQVPAATLQNFRALTTGPGAGHATADVLGWRAAIELVAATLHAGMDKMKAAYHSDPPPALTSPCGPNGMAFHRPNVRPLSVAGELVLAIASYLMEGPVTHEHVAHFLSCFVDPATKNARPWNVMSAGVLRYPTGPGDTTFSDFAHLQFNILRQLAATLVLLDCEAWR